MKDRAWIRNGFHSLRKDMDVDDSDVDLKRRRFKLIVIFGLFLSLATFLISISVSSGGIISVTDAIKATVSSVKIGRAHV